MKITGERKGGEKGEKKRGKRERQADRQTQKEEATVRTCFNRLLASYVIPGFASWLERHCGAFLLSDSLQCGTVGNAFITG